MQNLIVTVLVPWRPQRLRRIAERYARDLALDEIVVLRTYYGGVGDDNKMSRWVYDAAESFEVSNPGQDLFGDFEDRWWHVLDDASLFDTGSEKWQSVYGVLPELATPALQRNFFSQLGLGFAKEEILRVSETRELEEEDYEDTVAAAAVKGCWLLILDEAAFRDEEMLLVFRDMKGDVVRQIAIKPDEAKNLPHYRLRGSIRESGY
ncbi:uncharacterized protein FTOL_06989 [Fusarium torulosum]|uniref:Uncharacterized protein n=1 Tax=Fusarium torulosum TaxID=33205 RepID=A0AAE8MAC9_9HYPO|nr:uncharacterized protein FTOL_06989 [Fusarium torulosum]